jgi:pilus assembly protein CpaE
MPIIVEPNSTNSETILTVAGSSARVVGNLDDLRRELTQMPDEHAIVLGPSIDLESAVALADNLRVTRPAVSVILMRRRVDTSVLAEALRSGMREVVEERDLTGLGEAIKRALQVYQAVTGPSAHGPDAPIGRLVTVFSPKGGVGKTTIAANMAVALTNMDRRVCLVDLDLGFGDIAITLQLFPARTIADAVALEEGLDFTVLEPLLTPHRRGFTTLVAPVQPDAKDSIPATLVSKILSILKQNFDYVVVDTSPAFDEHVLQAFDETDELLLVTTLDVPTLKNVKIASETLDLLNFPKSRRHLVLNRADEKVGLSTEKVEVTLEMKIAQTIPTSAEVANATNAGEPITASLPKHPVSQALVRLAESVTGPKSDAAAAGSGTRAGDGKGARGAAPRRGLLRRGGK